MAGLPSVDDILGPAPRVPSVDDVLGPAPAAHPWQNDPVVTPQKWQNDPVVLATPAPPPGYTLDKAPQPPAGFTLDAPANSGPAVPLPEGWAPVNRNPAPQNNSVFDRFLNANPVGRVLDAFGQGMKNDWGSGPVGLSPDTEKALRDHGFFNDYNSGRTSILKSFNEAIVRPSAVTLDAAMRAGNSVLGGFGRATGQTANETGLTKALGNDPGRTLDEFEGMGELLPVALGVANDLGIISKPAGAADSVPVTRINEAEPMAAPAALAEKSAPLAAPVKTMATSEGIPQPRTLLAEVPSAVADKAGNINLDYIAAPEDVKDVIRQTAQANGGFSDARRGTMSLAETSNLADALGMTPESLDARKIGQAFNAEQITAARNLLVQSAVNVRDLAAKAATGDESALQDFLQAEARHKSIQEQVAGLTAEGGRALNAFKIMAGQTKDAQDLGEVLKSMGDSPEDAAARAKAIGDMDSPDKVSRFLTDSRKPTFKDQFLEYWINGLLSGPATHTTYSASNALYAMWKAGVDTPLAASIGKVRQMFSDADAQRVYLGESGAELHGIVQGAQEGLIPAREAIKSGIPGALPGEDPWMNAPGAIPGLPGKAIRAPSNVIAGIHTFTRSVGYRQSINKLAYRAAADEKLDGDDFAQRMAQLANDPTPEMMATSRDAATSQAFMSRNVLAESWFKGLADIVQATDDPDRYGARYVDNMAASLVPFSVGMSQIARAIDPDLRSARGLVDTIKSRVPFLSETVLPKYDIWGQPIENQGALGVDGLSAIYESRVNHDPVNQELYSLGVFPAAPEQKIQGIKLTDEQYGEYQRTAGRLAKVQLDQMVNNPEWAAVPEFARKEIFENTITNSRQIARGFMQMNHPELITQAIAARQKQITGN